MKDARQLKHRNRDGSYQPTLRLGVVGGVSTALHCECSADDRLVCVDVNDARMPMPGGWTISIGWMSMRGQSWPDVAASFLGMWAVMMVAMMMPSLVAMLRRYGQAVRRTSENLGRLISFVGIGYFSAWILFGVAMFPLGAALATVETQQQALASAEPIAVGAAVLIAGAIQFTAWKAHHLDCCQADQECCRRLPADTGNASGGTF